MKPIAQLEKEIDVLIDSKDRILQQWVSFDEVDSILKSHGLQQEYFVDTYASAIFNYYVGVVKGETQIGDCPVMAQFLDYLKEHDVSSSELFLICTHFRRSMLDVLFDLGRINKTLFDDVSYVFDLNFSGVLDQYSGRIYKAQRETQKHKHRFEAYNTAIEHSAIVSKSDPRGRITYVNPLFSKISGYAREELIGMSARGLCEDHETAALCDEIWEQLGRKKTFNGVIAHKSKRGDIYYTESTIVPMLDLNGRIEEYLSIAYDVTELIRSRDTALQAEKIKDQFLANMSHEIRTPLNAILGFVSVLRKRITDSENAHYLDVIDSSGKNLLTIIGDILDFAKIKEGKLHIDPHEFDPMQEFANVLELFSSKMFEKNIEYLTYIDPRLPVHVQADAVRIKQILSNFLSNALKFTPEHGQISVTIKMLENNLAISVKDSGCGIDKASIDRVFSAFEQAEGSTTRKYGGTGLGLAISHRLCNMMGGKIEVESDLGKGSLFRLTIPVKADEQRHEYEASDVYVQASKQKSMHLLKRYLQDMGMHLRKAPSPTYVNFYEYKDTKETRISPYILVCSGYMEEKQVLIPSLDAFKIMRCIKGQKHVQTESVSGPKYSGHILVAEDNRANQVLMKLILDEYGCTYKICENGQEAFEATKHEKYDLILMDEQMPVLNGIAAAQKITAYENRHGIEHTPIISVTANALKGDKERFFAAGMDGYIAKPIESDKLEEIFNKFIPVKGKIMGQNVALPAYDNLSAEEMAAQIGLNAKHIPILIQSFIDESGPTLGNLETAISSNNFEDIASYAHSIKGSSGNLKFDEIYELAKEMEFSAKAKEEDFPYTEALESIKKAIATISLA